MEPLGVVRFILHFLHQQGADRTCKVLPIQAHCNSPRKRKLIISANLHLKCECLKHSSIVQVFRLIVHSPPLVSMSLLTLELGSFDFRVMNMTIRPIYYHLIFTQFYSGFCLRWFFGAWSDQTHFITSVCVCVCVCVCNLWSHKVPVGMFDRTFKQGAQSTVETAPNEAIHLR